MQHRKDTEYAYRRAARERRAMLARAEDRAATRELRATARQDAAQAVAWHRENASVTL